MNDAPWIFVVGAPRSGTSLLRRLLSCHGRLWVNPELRIFDLLKLAGALEGGRGPNTQTEITPRGLALGRSFTRLIARHQLHELGKVRFGDKYPPYSTEIAHLAQLYPNAQFIHIIRDGRDVVASMARTHTANRGWRRSADVRPIAELTQNWAAFVLSARKAGKTLPPERYREIRYEHLLADPVPVLRQTLRFLDEALDEKIIQGAAEVRPGKNWRRTLAPAELEAFRRTPPAEGLILALGYPPTPSPSDRLAAVQAGCRPPPETPIQERVARGDASPALWFTAGEEAMARGDQKEAVAHYVRAIRGKHPDRRAILRLLGMPDLPESVFAAMNAERISDDEMCRALEDWVTGRGLDGAASQALFPPQRSTEAA